MIYLETSDNAATAETLKTLVAVMNVKATAKGLIVTINTDGTRCLPVIMNKLKEKGIDITTANLKKPTLDDVFVHFTGRDIRNAGAEKLHRIQPKKGR
jgi:ABC-2 type transport system ATP-binding protein